MSDKTEATAAPETVPRRPYHDEVFARLSEFGNTLCEDVPELEGLGLVVSWAVPQERVQPVLFIGRNGPLTRPAEIMHMAVQLHRSLHIQLEQAFETLRYIDKEMGRMQEEIRDKQSQLDALDTKLSASDQ